MIWPVLVEALCQARDRLKRTGLTADRVDAPAAQGYL